MWPRQLRYVRDLEIVLLIREAENSPMKQLQTPESLSRNCDVFVRRAASPVRAIRREDCTVRSAGRRHSRRHNLVARLRNQHPRLARLLFVENLGNRLDGHCNEHAYDCSLSLYRRRQRGPGDDRPSRRKVHLRQVRSLGETRWQRFQILLLPEKYDKLRALKHQLKCSPPAERGKFCTQAERVRSVARSRRTAL